MDEEPTSRWWWLALPFVAALWLLALLWRLWWAVLVLVIVVGVPLGLLGVFEKDPAPERANCAGFHFVRELKREVQITEFQSVEPDSGWTCEYSLNDEEAFVRFKRVGGELQLELEGRGASNDAYDGASELATAEGYHDK